MTNDETDEDYFRELKEKELDLILFGENPQTELNDAWAVLIRYIQS